MRVAKILLPCMIGVALSSAASAEVYQSKDAQGNTVFSDRPSQGSAEVKVPPTNAADPVAITPRPPPSPETPEAPARPRKSPAKPLSTEREEIDDDYLYYGDNYDRDEMDDQTRRAQRRDDDEVAKPKRDRPVKVEPYRTTTRPAGGGAGRR